jgi:flagellin
MLPVAKTAPDISKEELIMLNSVNTNRGALVALQNLNATNSELGVTQNRINTGKKVASVKDNGAIWAIAQGQRAEISSLGVVKDSLSRGQSVVDVAIAAGESISDLLVEMKAKALAATDTTLTDDSREALNTDFKALRDQITAVVDNASFDGANMLKASATRWPPWPTPRAVRRSTSRRRAWRSAARPSPSRRRLR